MRLLSHSETSRLMSCQAAWDFLYGGRLMGGVCLRPRLTPEPLSAGRAWGAGVASWHSTGSVASGHAAIRAVLEEDAADHRAQGLWVPETHDRTVEHLAGMLSEYAADCERLEPFNGLETELLVPIPSRSGSRASSRFRLRAFLDGLTVDESGRTWIVEFKLRSRLHSLRQIALSQQPRWYAWAWWQWTGVRPAGVIVDERRNRRPEPVRINKDGRPSRVQSCREAAYVAACREAGVDPDDGTVQQLRAAPWQQRHRIAFRDGELAEVGPQLVSVARQIRLLERGELYPIRNAHPGNCARCQFVEICEDPTGSPDLVDLLFERIPPKRVRP